MSYYSNGNYNSSSANGGYPMRLGQGQPNHAALAQGQAFQRQQAIPQQQPALYQRPQAPPQQAPAPRQTFPPTRAPPPPPIHFVLDRQYTLCRAPSPPAQPAPQHVPAALAPHYTPARDGAHYTPTRNLPHHTPARDGPLYTPGCDGSHHTPARYVPPALRNGPQYTPAPAPHTPYAPAAAPALVPFRCSHPQCGGRVVMVASPREHMWAAHRVRI